MRLSEQGDYFQFWLQFLASEGFQAARTRLLDLFVTMREVKKEPQAILEFQQKICRDIITLQFLKTDLRDIDTSVAKFADHMRLTVMHLLDALVWRLVN